MAIKTNHITYLQMMDIFEQFANDHYEINHFGNGDFWEVVETTKLNEFDYKNYPILWIADAGATFTDGELDYSFQVIVCDIQFDKDGEALYENQIKSNMLLIYQDLLAYLTINPQFKGNSVRIFDSGTSTGLSFTERFSDNLVGWIFDITIRQPINLNICEIPKA